MAFKTINKYNEERYGGMFLLRNDGDYADVVILYRSTDDVLVADSHYIKSADYTGYVSCNGRGCPACAKGIRVQPKLFIPVYNIEADAIQFFDRSVRFEPQLQQEVFRNFPNPSDYVFRITRHGAAGDVNTTYAFTCVGRNTSFTYDSIMSKFNTEFPKYFYQICKEYSSPELSLMLNSTADTNVSTSSMQDYQITPRVSTRPDTVPEPDMIIPNVSPTSFDVVSSDENFDELEDEPVF